ARDGERRGERRGRRGDPPLLRRLRRAVAVADGVELAGRADAGELSRREQDRRHRRDRHAGADAPAAHRRRAAPRHLDDDAGRRRGGDGSARGARRSPSREGAALVKDVTAGAAYTWDEPSWVPPDERSARKILPADLHVVAYDFGIKRNILAQLRDLGCRVTV